MLCSCSAALTLSSPVHVQLNAISTHGLMCVCVCVCVFSKQVPMFNEEAHCALIVERCCAIAWPRSRVLIQVRDAVTASSYETDSTELIGHLGCMHIRPTQPL